MPVKKETAPEKKTTAPVKKQTAPAKRMCHGERCLPTVPTGQGYCPMGPRLVGPGAVLPWLRTVK